MEKLRKVNNFSELKVGQIVIVMDCRLCGRAKCRNMLIKLRNGQYYSHDKTIVTGPYYNVLSNCNNTTNTAISPWGVSQGRVWLVEDNLEKEDKVENVKRLEKIE